MKRETAPAKKAIKASAIVIATIVTHTCAGLLVVLRLHLLLDLGQARGMTQRDDSLVVLRRQ